MMTHLFTCMCTRLHAIQSSPYNFFLLYKRGLMHVQCLANKRGSAYELQLIDLKVTFQIPLPIQTQQTWVWGDWCMVQMSLTQLALKLGGWIRIHSLGETFKKKCYLKMRKCHAFAQRGWNISVTERKVEWESAVQSILQLRNCVKVWKWRIDRRAIWRSSVHLKVFKRLLQNFLFFCLMCIPSALLFCLLLFCFNWHLPTSKLQLGSCLSIFVMELRHQD